MKDNKPRKLIKTSIYEDQDNIKNNKNKKKQVQVKEKVNVKSNKFWNDIYKEEGDDIEKYVR
ncbi:MAG TPA: hypothetical protein PK047_11070 [Saprospiraceae bacterium]|jgi:hypothetical protein|nr:hypothetical protein [Saprospiraceae bacterium]HRO09399.1 hypothetical protein [Saprospiraceae bacterium]HRP41588.1 hypothetical protein [Saprospiraceae bacterium]